MQFIKGQIQQKKEVIKEFKKIRKSMVGHKINYNISQSFCIDGKNRGKKRTKSQVTKNYVIKIKKQKKETSLLDIV